MSWIKGGTDGARAGGRFLRPLLAVGFVVGVGLLVRPVEATSFGPAFHTITTSDDGKIVTVAFEGPIFGGRTRTSAAGVTPETYTGSGSLTFSVTGAPAPTVAKASGSDTYTLTFAAAVVPHSTSIAVGTAYDGTGQPLTVPAIPVPFSTADLDGLVAGLKVLPALPDLTDEQADLPFVRDWLSANPRTITELVPGLADLDATGTEAELLEDLDALGAFSAVTFQGRDVTIAFDPTFVGRTETMRGVAGVEEIGGVPFEVSLDGDARVGVGLGGTMTATVTGGALTVKPATSAPQIVLSTDTTYSPVGRLGVVDVTAPGSTLALDAALPITLACPSGSTCAPGTLTTTVGIPTGTASLTVDTVEVAFGSETKTFSSALLPLVQLSWSDLGDLTKVTGSYDTTSAVAGFTGASVSDITGGLQWVATWLTELEAHAGLGTELPVVGGSAGQLAALSTTFSEPVLALNDLLGLVGDLSAQELEDVCDPSAIGARVDALGLDVAELRALLGVETGDAATLLAALKTSATATAQTCDAFLGDIAYDATTNAITYAVRFSATNDLAEALGASLDLDVAAAAELDGLTLAVSGGDWSGSQASVDVDLTIGIKLGTPVSLGVANGVKANDFDGDGELDVVDIDKDGDGLPERFTFLEGDRCRGLASLFGTSPDALQDHLGTTGSTALGGASAEAQCDAKVVAGTAMSGLRIGGTDDGEAVTSLTAAHVCSAAAARFGLTGAELVTRNTTLSSSGVTRSGPLLTTSTCGTTVRAGGTNGAYGYDDAIAMTAAVVLPHRIYVADDSEVLSATVDISGTDLGAQADLGILDLDVTGEVDAALALAVGLTDPGASGTPKADGAVDLWELASMADADRLDDLVALTFDGPFSASFDLRNAVLMGSGSRGFDVHGDVSDLGGGFTFHDERLAEAPSPDGGTIHVGHDLDELVNLKDITPAQALQMVVGLLEEVAALGDAEAMSTPIPFLDTTPQDMVAFTQTFADVVERVEAREPEDLTALNESLNDALTAAGMPSELEIGVSADELTLTFDASRSVTASYPFVLSADDFPDLAPLTISPSDGGATVTATAGITFAPTLGISFGDDLDLADRIFLRGAAPAFDVEASAEVFGSVQLGPVMGSIRGTASVGDDAEDAHELAVVFLDADGEEVDEVTLGDLGEIVRDPGDRLDIVFSGPFSAHLDASATVAGIGRVSGTVDVTGDLSDPTDATIVTDGFDGVELTIDLGTFVDGSTAAARFVGRTLEQSEAISGDLPFLGDQLSSLATVGTDLRLAAEEIDALWQSLSDDPDQVTAFTDGIVEHLEGTLCAPLVAADQECEITIDILDADGEPTTLATATAFEIGLRIGKAEVEEVDLGAGLDLEVFAVDMDLQPTITYGYGLDVKLGVNLNDGFYLRPGGSMGPDFLQLFAGFDAQGVGAGVQVAGLAATVTDGSVVVGGGLGPDEDAAGIAVGLVDDKTKLTMRDLVNRRTKIESIVAPRYDLDVKAHLPLVVAVEGVADLSVPVHLSLVGSGMTAPEPQLVLGCSATLDVEVCPDGDESIELDAAAFVSQVLKPILADILGNPDFNPLAQPAIHDALESNIPIMDTRLRDLMRQAALASGQEPAWTLIEFLIDVGQIEFDCEAGSSEECFSGQIDLGWAEIKPEFVYHQPDDWGIPPTLVNLITTLRSISGATGLRPTTPTTPPTTTPPPVRPPTGTPTTPPRRPGITAGSMLSFPILEDPASALKLVLGGELEEPVTFLEFNPPVVTLGRGINLSQTLFDLDIGFLKGGLTLALKGNLGLNLHVGFGYDSTGITTGDPLDGFYLVDHEGYEVSLGGAIQGTIDGHFSVAGDLVSVRFRGSAGARLEAGLDLFDESIALPRDSRSNGKLHLWEIGVIEEAYPSPFCMFALGARFDVNLAFSGRAKVLGVTVFDETWKDSWVLVDEEYTCPPNPVPAHVDDERRLILNGGPAAEFRFDERGDVQEHFTVTGSGSSIQVSLVLRGADGAQLGSTITKSYDTSEFDEIHGDLGAGPNSVTIAEGLALPAVLVGGPQADTLRGGGGDDSIDGAGGDDLLAGGPGADLVLGGDGDDDLAGGAGDDELDGGDGANTYRFGDAFGTDALEDPGAQATFDLSAVTTPLTGRAFFDEASVETTGGTVTYWADEVVRLRGGSGADDVELNRSYPDGFVIDLAGGGDTVTLAFSGIHRTITVDDTGAPGEDDELVVQGTASDDLFLFRADGPDDSAAGATAVPATAGFIAMGAEDHAATEADDRLRLDPDLIDRVDYDDAIEAITTEGGAGENRFYLDDVAAPLALNGGDADDRVQVGQIYRNDREVPNVLAVGDEARTRSTFVEDGVAGDHLTYGVSHPTTIDGGGGDDEMTVYSNRAHLKLEGGDGDDLFVLRAFVLDGTVEAAGGSGDDKFDYVQNDKVEIDGGEGFNSMVIIGTPFSDGFILGPTGTDEAGDTVFGVEICPIAPLPAGETASTADPKDRLPVETGCAIDVEYRRIQSVVAQALHGNDVFWVRGSDAGTHYKLYGGTDGSTFYVQDPAAVAGPVTIEGDSDPNLDVSLRDPVVLPGEDGTPALGTQQVDYDRSEDWLVVDAADHTVDDVATLTACTGYDDVCRADASLLVGLGMGSDEESVPIRVGTDRSDPDLPLPILRDFPTGLAYHTIDELTVDLGAGDDDVTVESTHTSSDLDGQDTVTETLLRTGGGDDHVELVDDQGATRVETGAGDDEVEVRDTGAATEVALGDGADDVQVDAVSAPTELDLGEGDDVVRVGAGAGDVTGIAEQLDVVAGGGTDDVVVDASEGSEDEPGQRVDLDLVRVATVPTSGVVTELEMPGSVRHDAALESLRILTGAGGDVADVSGSLAGTTQLVSGAGADRTFVSSAADVAVGEPTPGLLTGTLDDVVGAVHVESGTGDNLLMISDRSSTVGREVDADAGTVAVTGLGAITYDADGTFARGVTTWFGAGIDDVDVIGSRSDEVTPALLAWEGRDPKAEPRTITTFNTGAGADTVEVGLPAGSGPLVVDLEEGDDDLLDLGSTAGVTAFGGAGADRIQTGAGDDLVFGDFGRVEYRTGTALAGIIGVPTRMDLTTGRAAAPSLVATCNVQPGVSGDVVSGCTGLDAVVGGRVVHPQVGAPTVPVRNWISVGAGDDVAFGGRDADWIDDAGGRNALVGDHGAVRRVLPTELGGRRTLTTNDGSIDTPVLEEAFAYVVDVHGSRGGAADVLLGGVDRDWVFAGPGVDLVNGRDGSDLVFGGDDADVLWGGLGNDRIYGGWGDDLVDLKRLAANARTSPDGWPVGTWWPRQPLVPRAGWAALAPVQDTDLVRATDNGSDLVFGGEGPDAMQADVGGAGPVPGDRLLDWRGAHNVYFVCDGAYGAGRIVRLSSPALVARLGELRVADGAGGVDGARQIAIPTSGNANPTHPAHPGNNLGC